MTVGIRRLKRIDPEIQRIKNSHRLLHDEYVDFASFVSNGLSDLDIPTVWASGAALTDMVERLEQEFVRAKLKNNERLLEALPDELIVSQLTSLTREFAGLIMGFKQGQELALRASELAKLNLSNQQQGQQISGVLKPMAQTASLLADRAKRLVQMLDRAIDTADEKTVAVLGAATATATRSIVAFGRAMQPHLKTAGVASAVAGSQLDLILKLSGDPNGDALRAAMLYLSGNADALYSFANHDPVMRRWLDWLIGEIKLIETAETENPPRRLR